MNFLNNYLKNLYDMNTDNILKPISRKLRKKENWQVKSIVLNVRIVLMSMED